MNSLASMRHLPSRSPPAGYQISDAESMPRHRVFPPRAEQRGCAARFPGSRRPARHRGAAAATHPPTGQIHDESQVIPTAAVVRLAKRYADSGRAATGQNRTKECRDGGYMRVLPLLGVAGELASGHRRSLIPACSMPGTMPARAGVRRLRMKAYDGRISPRWGVRSQDRISVYRRQPLPSSTVPPPLERRRTAHRPRRRLPRPRPRGRGRRRAKDHGGNRHLPQAQHLAAAARLRFQEQRLIKGQVRYAGRETQVKKVHGRCR